MSSTDHGWWQCWEVVQPWRGRASRKEERLLGVYPWKGCGAWHSLLPNSTKQAAFAPSCPPHLVFYLLQVQRTRPPNQIRPWNHEPKKNLPFQFLPWVFCHNHQKLTQNSKDLWRHCEQKPNSIGIAITTHPPDKINTCEWTVTRMNKWIHGLIQGVGGTVLHYRIPKVNA